MGARAFAAEAGTPAEARRRLPPALARLAIDASYAAMLVALVPWAIGRACLDEKARARWLAYCRDVPARFGSRRRRTSSAPCVWVHGVSVGEVKAASRLVESIEACVPGVEVVVTATTDTGYRVARERYPGRRVEFYPPDLSWIVRAALNRLRPDLVVLVESEFWPNFLAELATRGIPVALVNGKISERSASRFARIRPLARALLSRLSSCCVQLPVYADRFRALGVPDDRIAVTGNLKLDNVPLREDPARSARYARLLGLTAGRPLLVAGSTHPSEERAIGEVVRRLRAAGTALSVVVAPRHPGRADAAQADLECAGLAVVRRSRLAEGGTPPPPDTAVLLDSVGELEVMYSLATAVFVGGSLVRHGGQNMMEPASLGKPVLVGPHAFNFRGEVDLLLAHGGIAQVKDARGVEETLARWLRAPEEAHEVGARGRAAILASKGATERTVEVLAPLLAGLRARSEARTTPSRTGRCS